MVEAAGSSEVSVQKCQLNTWMNNVVKSFGFVTYF